MLSREKTIYNLAYQSLCRSLVGVFALVGSTSCLSLTGTGTAETTATDTTATGSTPTVTLTSSSQSVTEGNSGSTTVTITATLSATSSTSVTVPFTISGTGTNSSDHNCSDSSITVEAGSLTGTATCTISGDSTWESDETIIVTMTDASVSGATPSDPKVHTVTISNDDSFTPAVISPKLWLDAGSGVRVQPRCGSQAAASFTAANSESLSTVDTAALSADGNQDYTIAAWVRYDSLGGNIISKWDFTGTDREWVVHRSGDNFRFEVRNNADSGSTAVTSDAITDQGPMSTNLWYFVVAWHNATDDTINIRINDHGTSDSAAHAGGMRDSDSPVVLGSQEDNSNYIDGDLDSVAIWKRILTADEITELYNGGRPISYTQVHDGLKTSLSAWWDLDEASGTRDDAHSVHDLTDNNTVTNHTGLHTDCEGSLAPAERTYSAHNGASSYLSINDNGSVSNADNDFSFAGWVMVDYPHETEFWDTPTVLSKWSTAGGGSNQDYMLYLAETSSYLPVWQVRNAADSATVSVSAVTSAPTGLEYHKWYFIYMYHDSTNDEIGISVNDGTIDTSAIAGGIYDSGTLFQMFRVHSGGNQLRGAMQSWGYWKKVLSSAEVTSLYNSGRAMSYSDLSGTLTTSLESYWELDEATAATRDDSAGSNDLSDTNSVSQWAAQSSAVGAWEDQSGNANHLSQSKPAHQPRYRATAGPNSTPVIEFDGTNDFIKAADINIGKNVTGLTAFVVMQNALGGTEEQPFCISTNNATENRFFFATEKGGNTADYQAGGRRLDADSEDYATSTSSYTASTFSITTAKVDYSGAEVILYRDGASVGSDSSFQTSGSTSNTNAARIVLGAALDGTSTAFSGQVAEIIIAESALSDTLREETECYLSTKYSITVSHCD